MIARETDLPEMFALQKSETILTLVGAILSVASALDDVESRDGKSLTGLSMSIMRKVAVESSERDLWNVPLAYHRSKSGRKSWKERKLVKRSSSNSSSEINPNLGSTANKCVMTLSSHVMYECRPLTLVQEPAGASNVTDLTSWRYDLTTISDAALQWRIPDSVNDLRLWKQGIATINSYAFIALRHTLTILHLEHNSITYISKKAFAGLQHLDELYMSYNRLQSLPSCVFSDLSRLSFLSLQHNELEVIRRRTLGGLKSLTFVDLSSNLLEDVHNDAFQSLQGRRSIAIDLRKNRLLHPRKGWLTTSSRDVCKVTSRNKPVLRHTTHATPHDVTSAHPSVAGNTSLLASQMRVNRRGNFSRNQRHIFTRILWASGNPWDCGCEESSETFEFMHTAISLTSKNVLQTLNCTVKDGTLVALQRLDGYYSVWDISMPCASPPELAGVNLGLLSKAVPSLVRSCCNESRETRGFPWRRREACDATKEWYNNLTMNCTAHESGGGGTDDGLNDNEVTIIGIVIVVIIPVLLTLCPDCDRSVAPVQKGQRASDSELPSASHNTNNNATNNIFRDSRSTYTVRTFSDRTRIFSNYSSTRCYGGGCSLQV